MTGKSCELKHASSNNRRHGIISADMLALNRSVLLHLGGCCKTNFLPQNFCFHSHVAATKPSSVFMWSRNFPFYQTATSQSTFLHNCGNHITCPRRIRCCHPGNFSTLISVPLGIKKKLVRHFVLHVIRLHLEMRALQESRIPRFLDPWKGYR